MWRERLDSVVCSMDTTNADSYAVRSSACAQEQKLGFVGQFPGLRPRSHGPVAQRLGGL